jgi:hypothetical protein
MGGDYPRTPARAFIAACLSVLIIVVLWVAVVGPWVLLLTPLLVIYVIGAYFGGGLNDSTLKSYWRLRDMGLFGPTRRP